MATGHFPWTHKLYMKWGNEKIILILIFILESLKDWYKIHVLNPFIYSIATSPPTAFFPLCIYGFISLFFLPVFILPSLFSFSSSSFVFIMKYNMHSEKAIQILLLISKNIDLTQCYFYFLLFFSFLVSILLYFFFLNRCYNYELCSDCVDDF